MSQYGTIYRAEWLMANESTAVEYSVYDTEHIIDDSDTPTIYDFKTSGNPLTVSVINNGRTKWGIFAKQAVFEFQSTATINAYTFVDSKDQRWLVEAKVNGAMMFTGFLVLSEVSRPFLPNPQFITLTASDNLGLLKEKELEYDDGTRFVGKYKLIEIISRCLLKTGLSLDIKVANNIRVYDGGFLDSSNHLYDTVYVPCETWRQDSDTWDNCYDILNSILDKDCFLTQYNGEWWIRRPDDFDDTLVYVTSFDPDGTNPTVSAGAVYTKNIGSGGDAVWIERTQRTEYDRPYKYAKHKYAIDIPEIPYNKQFEIGDLVTTVSPTQKRYKVDGWTLQQNLTTPGAPAGEQFIERIFDGNDYETERYLLLTSPVSPTAENFTTCTPMRVHEKDKFSFSQDFKWASNISGSGSTYTQRVVTVRLIADDGSYWMLDDDGTWFQSNSTWSVNLKFFEFQFVPNDEDETEFNTISCDARPVPKTGNVYVDLYALNQQGSAIDDVDIKFAPLEFTYIPFINGSYQEYESVAAKVERTDSGYSANLNEDVTISDADKHLQKGGLHYPTNSPTLVITGAAITFNSGNSFQRSGWHVLSFYPGQILIISSTTSNNITTRVLSVDYTGGNTVVTVFDTTVAEVSATTDFASFITDPVRSFFNATPFLNSDPPDTTYVHPFEYIRAYSTFNQNRRTIRYFSGELLGLNGTWCDMIHKYQLSDADLDSSFRKFMMIEMEQNWKTGRWRAKFAETHHNDGKVYTDPYEYKYIKNG